MQEGASAKLQPSVCSQALHRRTQRVAPCAKATKAGMIVAARLDGRCTPCEGRLGEAAAGSSGIHKSLGEDVVYIYIYIQ